MCTFLTLLAEISIVTVNCQCNKIKLSIFILESKVRFLNDYFNLTAAE